MLKKPSPQKLLLDCFGLLAVSIVTIASHKPETLGALSSLQTSERNALIGGAVVFVICTLIWYQNAVLPGFHTLGTVIPSVAVAFSVLLMVIVLLRIDYSRSVLLLFFSYCELWFLIRAIADIRSTKLKLLLIPYGRALNLSKLRGEDSFVLLSSPKLPVGQEIDGVVADLHYPDLPDEWGQFLAQLSIDQVPVFDSAAVYETLTGRVSLDHLANSRLGMLQPPTLYLPIKRGLELLAAVILLIPATLLTLVAAVMIRIDSQGPVIFKQQRVGLNGRRFTMYKFRTMTVTAGDGRFTKSTSIEDARITKPGKLLRSVRMDELPQLWNVLRGEMSLIGPRPAVASVDEQNRQLIPYYRHRHVIRPGLTGWAQVSQGYALDEDPDSTREKIERDFYYIKHLSFWTDLLIVALTIHTIVRARGSR